MLFANQHPILLSGKLAINYEPYNELGADVLNERANMVFKNKSLAEKFKHMEIDRQLEKEDESSQDNIFPESKANMFTKFGQQDVIKEFHEKKTWEEKYKVALSLRDPRAQFILKRLFLMKVQPLYQMMILNQYIGNSTIA